jgi:hypothetical protein
VVETGGKLFSAINNTEWEICGSVIKLESFLMTDVGGFSALYKSYCCNMQQWIGNSAQDRDKSNFCPRCPAKPSERDKKDPDFFNKLECELKEIYGFLREHFRCDLLHMNTRVVMMKLQRLHELGYETEIAEFLKLHKVRSQLIWKDVERGHTVEWTETMDGNEVERLVRSGLTSQRRKRSESCGTFGERFMSV